MILQNTSVTNCLRNFSSTETLSMENKFKCDTCCSYQVSEELSSVFVKSISDVLGSS